MFEVARPQDWSTTPPPSLNLCSMPNLYAERKTMNALCQRTSRTEEALRRRRDLLAVARIRHVFLAVQGFVHHQYPRSPWLRLCVRCPRISRERRNGNPRNVAHVGHYPSTVCVAPAAAWLSDRTICAVALHEVGHSISWQLWGRSRERDADCCIYFLTGIRINYSGPLLLQRISTAAVRRILGDRARC